MGMSLAEVVQLKRADEQANGTPTRLDIQWGTPGNGKHEGSRVCEYRHCALGPDGGPKHLDITNATGFCRQHWRFSRAGRHLTSKVTQGV